jgi:hypothetical protein
VVRRQHQQQQQRQQGLSAPLARPVAASMTVTQPRMMRGQSLARRLQEQQG